MVDFHSHILPRIDDGSSSLEMSIKMLQMEAEQGITQVVATPHFYAQQDKLENFLKRREQAQRVLQREMEKHPGLPEVHLGAEVHFFRGISEVEFLRYLTIRQNRSLLIEMPAPPWDEAVYRELEAIWVRREILPIIAHIDRYISPLRTFNIPQRLAQLPVLVQANASFFTQLKTSSMAMRMLNAGKIHLIGSDCHNLSDRKPDMGKAVDRIKKKLGEDALARINEYETKVLNYLP